MNEFLGWVGIVLLIFFGIVFLGNDCENAHKARARFGRWMDSDLPAQVHKVDAGAR